MREMTAADLSRERHADITAHVFDDDGNVIGTCWPFLRPHQTPAERVVEAARVVCRIRALGRANGMTIPLGIDLKWALVDLEEALAELDGDDHG